MDTLKVTDALKRGGFTEPQARALVDVLVELVGGLATKEDVAEIRRTMVTKQELAEFRHEMDVKISELRHEMELLRRDMTIRLGAMIALAAGIIVTLQKLI